MFRPLAGAGAWRWACAAAFLSAWQSPAHPATAAPTDAVARWQTYIAEASRRFGIPEAWIMRVMYAESGGQTMLNGRPIRSRVGAIGLMQLMPGTWEELRIAHGLGSNPDDPRDNILAGTAYLRRMYDRFGYPGLFAAYNAGPGRYAAYLARRSSLPGETIAYLANVAGPDRTDASAADAPPRQLLFALRHDLVGDSKPAAQAPADSGIFAVRKVIP